MALQILENARSGEGAVQLSGNFFVIGAATYIEFDKRKIRVLDSVLSAIDELDYAGIEYTNRGREPRRIGFGHFRKIQSVMSKGAKDIFWREIGIVGDGKRADYLTDRSNGQSIEVNGRLTGGSVTLPGRFGPTLLLSTIVTREGHELPSQGWSSNRLVIGEKERDNWRPILMVKAIEYIDYAVS
jgi:hypothetical protein